MRTPRRRVITAAAIAAAVLATAAPASADTSQQWTVTDDSGSSWAVVDDTTHGIHGDQPSQVCIYAPGDTSPCGAAARSRARTAARSVTTRRKKATTIRRHTRTRTRQATPITRQATPTRIRRLAGNRRWRPAVGCQPVRVIGAHRTTRVVAGGTWWSIGQCTGAGITALQAANPRLAARGLQPGDLVTIPGGIR